MSDIQRYYVWNLHHTVPDQQSVVVLYDDHIADKADLKAENFLLRNELADAQARIAELEKALIKSSDKLYETRKQIDLHDSIKAKGIKEMLCDNNYEESTGWIEEYADKLEKQ